MNKDHYIPTRKVTLDQLLDTVNLGHCRFTNPDVKLTQAEGIALNAVQMHSRMVEILYSYTQGLITKAEFNQQIIVELLYHSEI